MTIEEFNEKVKVGDSIWYKDDFDRTQTATIKHPASKLGSGTSVMWLEGTGSYALERFIDKCPVEVKELPDLYADLYIRILEIMEDSLNGDKLRMLPHSIQVQIENRVLEEGTILKALMRHFAYWISTEEAMKL
jgi:hypothetical protein